MGCQAAWAAGARSSLHKAWRPSPKRAAVPRPAWQASLGPAGSIGGPKSLHPGCRQQRNQGEAQPALAPPLAGSARGAPAAGADGHGGHLDAALCAAGAVPGADDQAGRALIRLGWECLGQRCQMAAREVPSACKCQLRAAAGASALAAPSPTRKPGPAAPAWPCLQAKRGGPRPAPDHCARGGQGAFLHHRIRLHPECAAPRLRLRHRSWACIMP